MEKANFGQLVSFIFGIANDCLVDVYDVGDYRKIILPMIVLRRFDAVLEPTKQAVLTMKQQLDSAGITDQDDALCSVAGEAFCNSSPYILSDLKSRTNQQQLKADFILYLDGFSQNVQDIIKKFEFRNQIDKLSEHDILGLLISKFTDPSVNLSSRPVTNAAGVTLPALDNHTMGTVFEEVIRKFNEETNITDAGRHFTPRDIVELITDLAFVPVKDKIQNTTYRIYDGACGTGGMLTVAEQRIREIAKEYGKKVSIHLYGQENADETYAIAKSDMLVKGEGSQSNNIFFGSTISNDGFAGETFDFCLSNPPFGTPWKTDLKAWGDIKKEDIADSRFVVSYKGQNFSLIPDIGDPQMLFLANNISKMKRNTKLGTRIVEVHNGSSLFTGKAGQGPSNLRQYIIEQDLLECIVALPEKMFYNTGIGTYLWVLTNKKEERRKGKVQLIDATSFKKPLRKNLGEKNCEVTEDIRRQILELYMAFDAADPKYSKIFPNSEFGYWEVPVYTPQLDENGQPIVDKKGKPVKPNTDKEQVPFSYEGGIEAFIENEVKPYAPLAYIRPGTEKIGYELSFTKYFYQPVQLRTLEEITADIRAIEAETDGLLDEIIGG
ncbi:MAG: SAM-dependent DNA methyltransferase [Clostridia bacterium]|nr:SAM-dependent DNA methyltransferase [Clostridia bacterium]